MQRALKKKIDIDCSEITNYKYSFEYALMPERQVVDRPLVKSAYKNIFLIS